MSVDWTKPIEAVHEDGRVVPCTFMRDDESSFLPMQVAGVPNDGPDHPYVEGYFNQEGVRNKSLWRIRNVQPAAAKPAEIDAALVDRMVAFVREMAGKGRGFDSDTTLYMVASQFDEARAIVAELPEPVDPDLLEARRYLVDAQYCLQSSADSGRFDDHEVVGGFLAGLARGRQLEREAK